MSCFCYSVLFPWLLAMASQKHVGVGNLGPRLFTPSPLHTTTRDLQSPVSLSKLTLPFHLVTHLSPTLSKILSFFCYFFLQQDIWTSISRDHSRSYVSEQAIGHVRINTESKVRSQDPWVTGMQPARLDTPPTCWALWRCRGTKGWYSEAGGGSGTGLGSFPSGDPPSSHLILYLPGQVLCMNKKSVVCGVKCELSLRRATFPSISCPMAVIGVLKSILDLNPVLTGVPIQPQLPAPLLLWGRLAYHTYSTFRKLFQFGQRASLWFLSYYSQFTAISYCNSDELTKPRQSDEIGHGSHSEATEIL